MRIHHARPLGLITAGFAAVLAGSPTLAVDNAFATHAELGLMQGFPPPKELRVDRSNALFGVPYNRWSYQNMRSLYPSANIPTANVPVTINRKIDGGIDSLTAKRENGEVVDMPTPTPASPNTPRCWDSSTRHRKRSRPTASMNICPPCPLKKATRTATSFTIPFGV